MNYCVQNLLVVLCLMGTAVASTGENFLERYEGRIFSGTDGYSKCLDKLKDVEAKLSSIDGFKVVASVCRTVAAAKKWQVVVDYDRPFGLMADTFKRTIGSKCESLVDSADKAISSADFVVLDTFCRENWIGEQELVSNVIRLGGSNVRDMQYTPTFSTNQQCVDYAEDLRTKALAIGLTPVIDLCLAFRGFDSGDIYFRHVFSHTIDTSKALHLMKGPLLKRGESCETKEASVRESLQKEEIELLNIHCLMSGKQVYQAIRYVDDVLPRVKTFESVPFMSLGECESSIAKAIPIFEETEKRVLMSFCSANFNEDEYRYTIHYLRKPITE